MHILSKSLINNNNNNNIYLYMYIYYIYYVIGDLILISFSSLNAMFS